MRAMGITVGSGSTPNTIFAIWASHLEREDALTGDLAVIDRCVVDAMAYTRVLSLNSDLELRLFEQIAKLAVRRLDLVIHLEFTDFFTDKGADHETPVLRRQIANEIKVVMAELSPPRIDLDASDSGALDAAIRAIQSIIGRD